MGWEMGTRVIDIWMKCQTNKIRNLKSLCMSKYPTASLLQVRWCTSIVGVFSNTSNAFVNSSASLDKVAVGDRICIKNHVNPDNYLFTSLENEKIWFMGYKLIVGEKIRD